MGARQTPRHRRGCHGVCGETEQSERGTATRTGNGTAVELRARVAGPDSLRSNEAPQTPRHRRGCHGVCGQFEQFERGTTTRTPIELRTGVADSDSLRSGGSPSECRAPKYRRGCHGVRGQLGHSERGTTTRTAIELRTGVADSDSLRSGESPSEYRAWNSASRSAGRGGNSWDSPSQRARAAAIPFWRYRGAY